MITKHLYPLLIIVVMAAGMYAQWQHGLYLNVKLDQAISANKELTDAVKSYDKRAQKVADAFKERDTANGQILKELDAVGRKVRSIADDGCIRARLPDELYVE